MKILLAILALALPAWSAEWLSLAGEWRFELDPNNAGLAAKWHERSLADTIRLPGTTDEGRKGEPNTRVETAHLTRVHPYVGPAWYQSEFDVPNSWKGKRLRLFLERTKNSRVSIDGQALAGPQESLTTPHIYPLPELAPGRHRLTLRIDNADHPPIGDPHQITEHTQTNWNGVIGRVGLEVVDPVSIGNVQLYPDRARRSMHIVVRLEGALDTSVTGTLTAVVPGSTPVSKAVSGEASTYEFDYPLAQRLADWDEFAPVLHTLRLDLSVTAQGAASRDTREARFGIRDFRAQGNRFQVNGHTAFLRGKVDNCVFPLTGYPPMDVEGWLEVFRIAKDWGINHYRFHSWTPPEAAFEAADQLGIYLQPELPNWAAFGEPAHDKFLWAEGERILETFGNHPSFVMLSLGNELGGKQELMAPFIKHFKSLDPRHLYAQGTNNWFREVPADDDYWSSFQYQGRKIRASYGNTDPPLGHVQTGPASTEKDYSKEIAGARVPVVSHEIAEYQVAPDFREIPRYTGVLRARNLEAFRDRLEKSGLGDQAHDLFRASGALSVLCYREDIEAALRTRDFGGFQLLDLQDFPGQGTALVGMLNAFMESKGLIEPAKWREFCSETVPLARFPKYTWTQSEPFVARLQLAHYGAAPLPSAVAAWTLQDAAGATVASGRLPAVAVPQGSLTDIGEIRVSLATAKAPARLNLLVSIEGTAARNEYPLWVYPSAVKTDAREVVIARSLDDTARQALTAGRRVLLLPEPPTLKNSVEGIWASDFWNWGMFKGFSEERKLPVAPGTLGLLCDPRHPAFDRFPTEFHSNWQWFELMQHSRALILDGMARGYRPVLQVIDNYERAHRLGAIVEGKVGPGRLLICSIDLPGLQHRPEARQLLHSLLEYMNSDAFTPQAELTAATLAGLLR